MSDLFLSAGDQAILVARISAGERAAEDELVRCYTRRLFALLSARTGDREVARDLLQETLLAALQAIRGGLLSEPEKLEGFLQGTARNVANGYLRTRSRRPLSRFSPDAIPIEAPDLLETEQRDAAVRQALAELEPLDRDILTRTLVDGQKPAFIAEELGLDPVNVRQRKSRAAKKVAQFLKKLSRAGTGKIGTIWSSPRP